MVEKIADLLARFDPEKHRHKLMLDDAPLGIETGAEDPCPRCKRAILVGGCPYGDEDCPQFPTGEAVILTAQIEDLSPEEIEALPIEVVKARLHELGVNAEIPPWLKEIVERERD